MERTAFGSIAQKREHALGGRRMALGSHRNRHGCRQMASDRSHLARYSADLPWAERALGPPPSTLSRPASVGGRRARSTALHAFAPGFRRGTTRPSPPTLPHRAWQIRFGRDVSSRGREALPAG